MSSRLTKMIAPNASAAVGWLGSAEACGDDEQDEGPDDVALRL